MPKRSVARSAEVLVVGAGPAGSTVARELARQGHTVLLLDKASFPRPKTCGDGLTPRAVAALQALGLEDPIAAEAHPVEGTRLYGEAALDLWVPFRGLVDPWPPYGYVLPRARLDHLLLQAALAAGVRFLPGVTAERLVWAQGRVQGLRSTDGRLWRAPWVVIATGASVGLLRRSGLLRTPPHDILAARGYWRVPEESRYLEFFFLPEIPFGYAWAFPTGKGQMNVGVGVYRRPGATPTSVRRLLWDLVQHHPALAPRFRAHPEPRGGIQAYPLRSDFPRGPLGGPGWLAVGEAAGLVNPVTGEGIDLALESGRLAAQALHQALRLGKGSAGFRRYRRALLRAYGGLFRGLQLLRPVVMRPRALRILLRKAQRHPPLLRRIVGITLGHQTPYSAFWPSTWRWLLF